MKTIWEEKTLESICEVFADGDWIESKDQSDSGIRLIQTGNIGFGFFKDKEDKSRFISQETFNRLKCSEIFPGDILVSRLPDPVGKSCIIPDINGLMITGVDCTIIRLKSFVISEYVRYYQMSGKYLNDVQKNVSGATRQRISRKKLGIILIPIPPLPEQQRIVAILDEAFAAIDKAKDNAEKNLRNAKELFESYLQGVFENSSWKYGTIGDVCRVIAGQSPEGKYYNKIASGLPFYQGKKDYGVKYLGAPTTWTTKVTKEAEKNDILISVRAPVGPVNISTQKICIGRGLAAIRTSDLMEVEFLYNYLLVFERKIVGNTGAVFNSINKSQIEKIDIPIPSIPEQITTIKVIQKLSSETKRLESIYQKKLTDLEELKKSILQKAFNGELNTADLCA
jgi:type I restriction enzyme, S subunit